MGTFANRVMQLMEDTHEWMEGEYTVYERCVSNQINLALLSAPNIKGFVMPFNLAWQWAGYNTKRNAKRVLTGARGSLALIAGTDYIISNEGKNTEAIMMTGRAFNDFALAARTTKGIIYRDVSRMMLRGIFDIQKDIMKERLYLLMDKMNKQRTHSS